MAEIGSIKMSECVNRVAATITVRRDPAFRVRSWLGLKLILLGGYVFGIGRIDVVTVDQGPA